MSAASTTQCDAGYIRVSSRAQDHGMQEAAINRVCTARGGTIGRWYAEKRSSKTMARPELDRLLADARQGLFRRLYVFRLDRLCRTGIRDMLNVMHVFASYGVEVVSTSDGIDLNGPMAEVFLAFLAWAAKMERLAINERIAAARERMGEEGRPWGRPSRLSAEQRAKIRALKKAGRTVRAIAQAVKVPRSTVARVLSPKKSATGGEAVSRKVAPVSRRVPAGKKARQQGLSQ